MQRWWMASPCVLCHLLVLVGAGIKCRRRGGTMPVDLREMQDNMASGAGYEGTDEYTPVGRAIRSAIDKDARKVTVDGPARAAIHVLRWEAESKPLRRRCRLRISWPCICFAIRHGEPK